MIVLMILGGRSVLRKDQEQDQEQEQERRGDRDGLH